jgi:hypothetical protein
MTRQVLNVGIVANDGTGDTFRIAGQKINDNFAELYESTAVDSFIDISGNNITSTNTNGDINLQASGTGQILMSSLKVDNNIRFADNSIIATASNSDIILDAAGDGEVFVDQIKFKDNTIVNTNSSNNVVLDANGTGIVKINGFNIPNTDAPNNYLLRTDGSKDLTWVLPAIVTANTEISDGTITLNASAVATIDSFDISQYRSGKYFISVADSTNSRYEFVTANIIHDGSDAYVSSAGSVQSFGLPLLTFSADVSGGNANLKAIAISNDAHVIKFVRILQEI